MPTSDAALEDRPQTAYRPWQLDSLDPAPTPAQVAEPVRLPTADDVARIERAAAEEGFSRGFEEGRTAGLAALREETARMRALAEGLAEALAAADRTIAEDVVQLALAVARQVVRHEIEVRPDLVLGVVREALSGMPPSSGTTRLVVNPADATLVRTHLAEELTALGWALGSDPTIERGGCRIDGSVAEIDATLPTRWSRVVGALCQDRGWSDEH